MTNIPEKLKNTLEKLRGIKKPKEENKEKKQFYFAVYSLNREVDVLRFQDGTLGTIAIYSKGTYEFYSYFSGCKDRDISLKRINSSIKNSKSYISKDSSKEKPIQEAIEFLFKDHESYNFIEISKRELFERFHFIDDLPF